MTRDQSGAGGAVPRVLLIDDEDTIRFALRRFFSKLGWEVDDATDGGAALRKILDAPRAYYDLIISDLRMPGLSGVDFHDQLASARPELLPHVVFSTGDLSSSDVADFVQRTNCLVLQKPFELSALRETVQRIASGDSPGP
ncbi:MAG TPA: response regulator [Gemmatimonadaceae bacterium]|nr:response regulator [Gemmatimonadaceae bacterium]